MQIRTSSGAQISVEIINLTQKFKNKGYVLANLFSLAPFVLAGLKGVFFVVQRLAARQGRENVFMIWGLTIDNFYCAYDLSDRFWNL